MDVSPADSDISCLPSNARDPRNRIRIRRPYAEPGATFHCGAATGEGDVKVSIHVRRTSEAAGNERDVVAFALAAGLRQFNVLGLEWSHVDLAAAQAWVGTGQSKNGKPIAVPLNATALVVLRHRPGNHRDRVTHELQRLGDRRLRFGYSRKARGLAAKLTLCIVGRPCRDRTCDQRIKSPLLYQLS